MARTRRRSEFWKHVDAVGFIREASGTHGNSTTVAALTAGQTATFDVASGTNFVTGDPILIDTGEYLEYNVAATVLTATITPKYPILRAHPLGTAVKEATRTLVGDISDAGVRGGITAGDFTGVRAATRRVVQAYLVGHIELGAEFEIINWNPENIAFALGIPETKVTGAGTISSPYRLAIDPDDMNTEADTIIYFTGALKGGGVVEIQGWGAEMDPSAMMQTYLRGPAGNIPVRAKFVSSISCETY